MAEAPDDLRQRLDQQREAITDTVGQIENRVSPGRIVARRRYRARRRLTDWKDTIMGNDQPDYPNWAASPVAASSQRYGQVAWYGEGEGTHGDGGHLRERAAETAAAVRDVPEAVRRQAEGNPLAAGVIALAAGWLLGSLLPASRPEQQVARKLQPQLEEAARTVSAEASGLAEEMREPARQAVDDVKSRGEDAAQHVKDAAQDAAQHTREQAT
jgi:hypothetical protein